jgi:hypothetical protein
MKSLPLFHHFIECFTFLPVSLVFLLFHFLYFDHTFYDMFLAFSPTTLPIVKILRVPPVSVKFEIIKRIRLTCCQSSGSSLTSFLSFLISSTFFICSWAFWKRGQGATFTNCKGFVAGFGGGGFVIRHFVGKYSVLEFCVNRNEINSFETYELLSEVSKHLQK